MNVGQFRKVLSLAGQHYRSDGKEEVADALSAFAANLLQVEDTKSVAAFVKQVENAKKPTTSRAGGAGRRKR